MHLSSGLYDFGARWYDPFLQRWLTEDPLGEAGGLNLYRFAANDPLNQVDPWGQWLLFDRQAWGRLLQDLLLGDAGPALDPDANLALRQAAGVGLSAYTDENGTPVPLGELLATGLGAGVETASLLSTPGGEAAGALAARLSGKACRGLGRLAARTGAAAAEQALTVAAKKTPRLLGPGTSFGAKIEGQLAGRGWTKDLVQSAIDKPARTVPWRDTRHLPGGGRMNEPATAYYSQRGGYVVRNERTGDIVQVSDRTDPGWKAPWD
jgi:hypothetical protein